MRKKATGNLDAVARAICRSKSWVFVGQVGEGASKETFHIRFPGGESAALKVLRPNASLLRLQREITAMQRCDHESIGKFFTVEHFDLGGTGYRYITEEFIVGGSLEDRLRAGAFQRGELLALGEALISALSHVEPLKLVHRDLAPKNIMFREDGVTPVIVDFGLVRDLARSSLTHEWQAVGPGTPRYASPEQLNNQKAMIDWRSDQFSLGVVLSECAFGYHPYDDPASPLLDIVQRVSNRDAPTTRFAVDCVDQGLPVLGRMVSSWPYARYRRPKSLLESWKAQ